MKKSVAAVNKAMEIPAYKPTITLDSKLYPKLDTLKVDDVIDLSIKVKITNISRSQYSSGKELHVSGTIENASDEDNEHVDY